GIDDLPRVSHFQSIAGEGVRGQAENVQLVLGNEALLDRQHVDFRMLRDNADRRRAQGETVVYLAADGRPAAILGLAAPLKEDAAESVRRLREEPIRVLMLTGDHRATAAAVARRLGIDEFRADMLPDQKISLIQQLQAEGRAVAMVGDGVNDAPALTQAD